jgi:hypothetical protein
MNPPEKSDNYWSAYREGALAEHNRRGTAALKKADALAEIEQAIRDAFPAASDVTARAEVSDVLIKFATDQKPVSVRFSGESFAAYMRSEGVFRQQALKTLRLVCNFAFAREYEPNLDPVNPFIIDAEMALSNTGS